MVLRTAAVEEVSLSGRLSKREFSEDWMASDRDPQEKVKLEVNTGLRDTECHKS